MITVSEAFNLVLSTAQSYGAEMVSLENAIGRVLEEDILADRHFPPFDRVTMDGISIAFASLQKNQRKIKIESIAAAGCPKVSLQDSNKCIEVMTGAVLPEGTDTVIRYEDLEIIDGVCSINAEVRNGQNVHKEGSDHNTNSVLLSKGHKIKSIDINVLATVGKSKVAVVKTPSIAILSSGDELVPVDSEPLPHQIRMSNVHMLKARLSELDVESDHFHIQDDEIEIKNTLAKLIAKYDVILMSGGVSKGKFDFIPDVLTSLGVECLFHKVAQRPGKPLWFGRNKAITVFAFPGNPVSTLACFHKYFIPWLTKSTGQIYVQPFVILRAKTEFKPNLTCFAQAKIEFENGKIYADISKGNGSGDMVHPTEMDGFVELPQGKDVYQTDEVYSFIPFHSILK
ncbi:MAG: molybdopterin molybdotransferase [Saprospiraceae bacterium]|jgi:molybdopterin molybdotransferase